MVCEKNLTKTPRTHGSHKNLCLFKGVTRCSSCGNRCLLSRYSSLHPRIRYYSWTIQYAIVKICKYYFSWICECCLIFSSSKNKAHRTDTESYPLNSPSDTKRRGNCMENKQTPSPRFLWKSRSTIYFCRDS